MNTIRKTTNVNISEVLNLYSYTNNLNSAPFAENVLKKFIELNQEGTLEINGNTE